MEQGSIYNFAKLIFANCVSVDPPLPIALVLLIPPVAVINSASAYSAPDHCQPHFHSISSHRRFTRVAKKKEVDTYVLMLHHLTPLGDLHLLNLRRIRLHPVLCERLGEPVGDESVGMQPGEGDELPPKPPITQL